MTAGIYKITSPTGKIYIGQSWKIEERFRKYKTNNGAKNQQAIHNSFSKHGVENHNFEVIFEYTGDSQTALNNFEYFFWEVYRTQNEMLNIRIPFGARGKHSEETKAKMKRASKGRKFSPQHLAKIIASNRRITDQRRLNLSLAKKGKYMGEQNHMFGKEGNRGEKSHTAIINTSQAIDIWRMTNEGYRNCDIAKMFGVHRGLIQDIKRGKSWNHITGIPKHTKNNITDRVTI